MLALADITVTDNTLFTIFLVVGIVVGVIYILAFLLGRWRP